MEEQDFKTDGSLPEISKDMRGALASLPSFDDVPEQDEVSLSDDQTVIVVHDKVPTDESDSHEASGDVSDETVVATVESTERIAEAAPTTILGEPSDEEEALSSLVAAPDVMQVAHQEETAVATPIAPPIPLDSAQLPDPPYFSQETEGRHGTGRKVIKRLLVVLLAVLGAAAVIYLAVGFYFTTHFLPNTTVNGQDVSGLSVADLSAYVRSIGESFKSHLSGDGLDLTINGSDVGFVYDGEAYSKQAEEQIDPWHWPLHIAQAHEYVVDEAISCDESKLNELVGAAIDKANEGATQPKNATMRYDEASSKFVLVNDELGTAINKEAVLPIALEGVLTMQTEIAIGDDELVQPTVTRDNKELLATIDSVNGLLEKSIVLRIADQDATTIDRNLLSSWLTVNDQNHIDVNQDAIKEWAQGALSEQFDTVGKKRTFTRPDGKQIEVEGSTPEYDYGWCLDGEALSNVIAENLRSQNTDPIDVPMKKTAASWNPGGQDWPNRYIDVDLSEQHARMYDDSSNVIWETDCVSGNPIYSGGTETGVFYIYTKSSPMELIGLDYDHDGQPDYRTWVTYWMPFNGGEGLHDMTTRYAFGGNIYTYDGSHGCVNLPYSMAEQLYGLTNVGDTVVVHW